MDSDSERQRRDPAAAAFFDLDNTLLHGASLYLIGRGMHARGVISTAALLRGGWQQLVFRLAGERHDHISDVRERALALGAGVEVAPLVHLGEQIFDTLIAPRILHDSLALAHAHLERGEDVLIVTAAPVELARIVAHRLGLTDALGTVSEVHDGRWTGRLVGDFLHGPAKADAVRRLAEERGYDLSRCAAYTDSINDLPLLEAVGHPQAVNPDRRLRAIAHTRDWPIHDFRAARTRTALIAVGGALAGTSLAALAHRRTRRGSRAQPRQRAHLQRAGRTMNSVLRAATDRSRPHRPASR